MDRFFILTEDGDVQILRVNDLLNEIAVREIIQAAEHRIAGGFPNFVVDLSDMRFMNSIGINFLIKLKRRSKESGGKIAVVHAPEKVKQLLDITKLRPLFFLTDSLDEAIQYLST